MELLVILPAVQSTLRQFRILRGLSQLQLGDLSGLKNGQISALERGYRAPSLEKFVALVDALNLKPTEALQLARELARTSDQTRPKGAV